MKPSSEPAETPAPDPLSRCAEALDAPTVPPGVPQPVSQGVSLSAADSSSPDSSFAGQLPAIGSTMGDYEVESEIARGAMGVVYRARQKSIGRSVAIKMVLESDADTNSASSTLLFQRFENEARAAGGLSHPGIVPVYEVGRWNHLPYFAMALIDGKSLADLLRDGPLPPRRAAEIAKEVADAISHAHQQKVIHRDLKPANILIDKQGKAHVTDFGVSKVLESGSDLTTAGELIGTPHYMPPEQAGAKNAKIGPTSDVYSIGAVLYAMLTGRPPFLASTPMDVVAQVLTQEAVPPQTLNALIPTELDVITQQCLQKNSRDRYESSAALAEDLNRYLRGEPIFARPPGIGQRIKLFLRRHVLFASVSGTAALLLVFANVLAMGALIHARQQVTQLSDDLSVAKQMRVSERSVFKSVMQDADSDDGFAQFEIQRLVVSAKHYQETRPQLAIQIAMAAIQTARNHQHPEPQSMVDLIRNSIQTGLETSPETMPTEAEEDSSPAEEPTSDEPNSADLPAVAAVDPHADSDSRPNSTLHDKSRQEKQIDELTIDELMELATARFPDKMSVLDRELLGLPELIPSDDSESEETLPPKNHLDQESSQP